MIRNYVWTIKYDEWQNETMTKNNPQWLTLKTMLDVPTWNLWITFILSFRNVLRFLLFGLFVFHNVLLWQFGKKKNSMWKFSKILTETKIRLIKIPICFPFSMLCFSFIFYSFQISFLFSKKITKMQKKSTHTHTHTCTWTLFQFSFLYFYVNFYFHLFLFPFFYRYYFDYFDFKPAAR